MIENSFKADKTIESVVGIGLNVNQTDFENLPNASSLFNICNKEFDLDLLLEKIVLKIEDNCKFISEKNIQKVWDFYHQKLFKKDIELEFENDQNLKFNGKIIGVTKTGLLEVLVNNNLVKDSESKRYK